MVRTIGDVLARSFREVCEESNSRVKSEFNRVSDAEIEKIENFLKKVDLEKFDLITELKKFFEITEGDLKNI